MKATRLLAPFAALALAGSPLAAQLVQGTEPVPHGPKGGGAESIVVNQLDSSEILVTRWEHEVAYGYRLWRSTDSGLSFEPLLPASLPDEVRNLQVDPRDLSGQTLYGTSNDSVVRSVDFGQTWTDLGVVASGGLKGVLLPADGSSIYAYTYRTLLRSADGGATWVELPFTGPDGASEMAVAPSNEDVLYMGASNGLWKSVDAGASWYQPNPSFGEWVKAVGVHPMMPDVVFVGTTTCCSDPADQGVWRSFDGGATMTLTAPVPEYGTANFIEFDPSGAYLRVAMLPNIVASADLGGTWTADYSAFHELGVTPNDLGYDAAGNVYMVADSNAFPAPVGGGLYRQDVGGSTWTHLGFSSVTVRDVAVAEPGGDRYAAAGAIFRADPGADFEQLPALQNEITSIAVDPNDPTRLIAATMGGNNNLSMFSVETTGNTALSVYSQYGSGAVQDIAIDPNDPSKMVAAKEGLGWGVEGILYSSSGGLGWDKLSSTMEWGAREVAYDPHTPGRVLALMDGPAMSVSLDSGATWSAPTALWVGGGRAAGLELDPFVAGVIYAGDETGGLHRSDDDGATWISLGVGMQRASEIEMHPEMPGLLWVSDDTGQILVSGDRGARWRNGSTVPGGSDATALALDTADGSLLYGTTNASTWVQPQASPYVKLGAGTPGTGGFVPRLWAEGGLPEMTAGAPGWGIGGDLAVGFDGSNNDGLVVPVMGFGSLPFETAGGTWYVDLFTLPWAMLPATVALGTPGAGGTGSWFQSIPLLPDPTLVGGQVVFQALVRDSGASDPDMWVFSDALKVTLVP
jgi:hypothetical protein